MDNLKNSEYYLQQNKKDFSEVQICLPYLIFLSFHITIILHRGECFPLYHSSDTVDDKELISTFGSYQVC